MGVEVELLTTVPRACVETEFAAVVEEFARLESIFSRFDPASELSRLNRARSGTVSAELAELAALALQVRERTAGLVDVTVHDALVAWGYDRTYAEIAGRDLEAPAAATPCGGAFHVDAESGVVELHGSSRLDFGGLAKGYAVDRSLRLLAGRGPAVVNAGGDLAVTAHAEAPWPIGVETPEGGLTLAVASGALATSGRDARRWRATGRVAHHLIDPRTGAPSESDLVRATAWAPTAVEAEIRAKTLFLLGAEAAEAYARSEEIPAVLVGVSGGTLVTGPLAA